MIAQQLAIAEKKRKVAPAAAPSGSGTGTGARTAVSGSTRAWASVAARKPAGVGAFFSFSSGGSGATGCWWRGDAWKVSAAWQ